MWISISGILCILGILWIQSRAEGFQSAEKYLVQTFGDFRPATEIPRIEISAEPVPELEGKEFLTLKDLQIMKLTIDTQITRMESVRSSAANYQEKQTELEELSFRLSNILSAIQRNDAQLSEYPIRTATAKQFLEIIRKTDKVPRLFETLAPAPATHKEPSLELIAQSLKNELKQMQPDNESIYFQRVSALQKRILNNSMLGNPIPNELRTEFINTLKKVYTNLVI